MNDSLTNQLTMIGTCIALADSPLYKPVWDGQAPLDFGTDFARLKTDYGQATVVATLAGSATTGGADAKDIAETALENLAYQVARALASHYKKTGNLTDRAKVDIRIGKLQKLRDQALATRTTEIRDLANVAKEESGAVGRGITAARIAALTAAIATYETLRNQPRGQIVNRTTHLRDLATRVAALMEATHDLDDLALQMDTTEAGRLFIAAWKQARIIVDAGHGPTTPPVPTPPPAPPTPPTP